MPPTPSTDPGPRRSPGRSPRRSRARRSYGRTAWPRCSPSRAAPAAYSAATASYHPSHRKKRRSKRKPKHKKPKTERPLPDRLQLDDRDAFTSPPVWFLREPGQVVRVAGQQDDRSSLGERDRRQQRVDRAALTGQAGGAQQLAGLAAHALVDVADGDAAEYAVDPRIPGAAAKDLGQRGRRRDDL